MRKNIFFLSVSVFLFALSACVSVAPTGRNFAELSMAEQWESGRFAADSRDDALVVIGVAGRYHARWENDISDVEIANARIDAARRVAMFYGMNGIIESYYRQGASFFAFIAYSRINLERAVVDYMRFVERLTFDPDCDVLVFERGTLVRFSYATQVTRVNFASAVNADGRPSWLSSQNQPVPDGYMVAVGFSPNRVQLWDTVMRATEATAARLVKGINTQINTNIVDVPGEGSIVYIFSRSEGTLNNFRVLEFWIDPENMSVYTLGIARFVE